MASSSGTIKVHNAELYVEAMQSADWAVSDAQRLARAELAREEAEKRERKRQQEEGASSFAPHHSSTANTAALAGKRAVLEAEFSAKMDIAKRENDRRVHERMLRQERQFEDRYASFMARNREIVADSTRHEETDLLRERKRERLYQEWMQKVFLPTQGEINSKIEAADTEAIIAERNKQYQAYLDECNRSRRAGGGIHRDVIDTSQYDPFASTRGGGGRSNKNGTVNSNNSSNSTASGSALVAPITYKTVGLADDPLKNRITRESQLPGGTNSPSSGRGFGGTTGGPSLFVSSQLPLSRSQHQNPAAAGAVPKKQSTVSSSAATAASAKVGKVGAGSASLTARFGAKHGSYAQNHAHASKFQLLPSEALGTATTTSGGDPSFGDFGGASSSSPFGSARSNGQHPRLLPSVNAPSSSSAPVATSMTRVMANADPQYKFSANNSLFNAAKEPIPVRATLVEVTKWGRMDATPHGRYSDDNVGPTGRPRVASPGQKPEFLRSDVVFDHYNMPRGEAGARQAKVELSGAGKGKKCGFKDHSTANPLS